MVLLACVISTGMQPLSFFIYFFSFSDHTAATSEEAPGAMERALVGSASAVWMESLPITGDC